MGGVAGAHLSWTGSVEAAGRLQGPGLEQPAVSDFLAQQLPRSAASAGCAALRRLPLVVRALAAHRLVSLPLGALLTTYPSLHLALKLAGGAYLLYLAWRIAMSRSLSEKDGKAARPMTFLEAAAFQWVNPKAWVMAVTAMAVYSDPAAPFLSVLVVALAFALVNLPSVSTWAGFGMALRGFLADPVRLKWFNIAMGVALAVSLWPMLR